MSNSTVISSIGARVSTPPSGFQVDRPPIHAGKQLALTFDDGPDPTCTLHILAILAKYGIRATFFVIGEQAERYPQIIRAEFAAGHLLGNHTYLHPNLDEISDSRLKWELNATQRLISFDRTFDDAVSLSIRCSRRTDIGSGALRTTPGHTDGLFDNRYRDPFRGLEDTRQ